MAPPHPFCLCQHLPWTSVLSSGSESPILPGPELPCMQELFIIGSTANLLLLTVPSGDPLSSSSSSGGGGLQCSNSDHEHPFTGKQRAEACLICYLKPLEDRRVAFCVVGRAVQRWYRVSKMQVTRRKSTPVKNT